MLFVLVGVKFHTVSHLLEIELTGAFARLGIPELDETVVGGRKELSSGCVEGNVPNGLSVTNVGANQTAIIVHLPELKWKIIPGELHIFVTFF